VANSIMRDTDPRFIGGSIASPQNYFQLGDLSPARDYGIVVAGVTDGYLAPNPDAGAYEKGGTVWTAGYTPVAYTG
jgi:hypothetical protein